MKFRFSRIIPVLMAMLALPALAQFEIAPDHFDDNVAQNPRISKSHRHAEVDQQLATQQARLTSYRNQIRSQVASVEEARKAVISQTINTDRVYAKAAFQARERDLQALRRSLKAAIRDAKARIAALKTERNALTAAAPANHPAIRPSGQSGGMPVAMAR